MANTPVTSFRLTAFALVASAGASCGPLRQDGDVQAVRVYDLPDVYSSPDLSPVAIGSRNVVTFPAPGPAAGPILLRIASEPGAAIRYGFDEQPADTPYPYEYQAPVFVVPPVTIWAQAEKDGLRGVARAFEFTEDPNALPPIAPLVAKRLSVTKTFATASVADPVSAFAAPSIDERLPYTPTIDGSDADWPPSVLGRRVVLDAKGDVPSQYAAADLVQVAAGETDDSFYVMLRLAAKPRTYDRIAYGVEVGPSFITSATFGPGADLVYRWEVTNGTLQLWQKDDDSDDKKELKRSDTSIAVVGDVVEIRVAKADAPFLADQKELGVRAYAYEAVDKAFAQDRAEPVFLRSQFAMRAHRFGDDARPTEVQFLAAPSAMNDKFSQEYLALGELFVGDLERANGIRLVGRGSLPLFYTLKEDRGYAGLNTSDRGMLSTIGPNASLLAKAQILSHELAHYQNARSSKIDGRWLQEAMSEWSAERLLYRHFPARAVHRFLRTLRYDSYFAAVEDLGSDEFQLDEWGQDAAPLGYQKSLMFMALLEAELGQPALLKAFQRAQSEPFTTATLTEFLTKETGKNVSAMLPFWVKGASDPEQEFNPNFLFVDDDDDGLLNLDETVLGTDPFHPDSDGDGYMDGEELFAGGKPLTSQLANQTSPQLAGATSTATSLMLRLAGAPGDRFLYALDPFDPDLVDVFDGPIPMRPPFSVVARAQDDTQTHVLSRALYVDGAPVMIAFPSDNILPPTPRTTRDLRTDVTVVPNAGTASALTDAAGDMPDELAAYDLVAARVQHLSGHTHVTLTTRGKPDRFGSYGDYVVDFDNPTFAATGAVLTKAATFRLVGGAPYWQKQTGSDRAVKLMVSGVTVDYVGNEIRIKLVDSLLESWREADGEQWACAMTDVSLDNNRAVKDSIGCVVPSTGNYVARTGMASDHFGITKHTLQLFIQADEYTVNRADGLLALGLTVINEFERVLGRPWLDRSAWPIHVHYTTGSTVGTASERTGALLSAPEAIEGDDFDYLFVEQLARLAIVDTLGTVEVPYWVQETFVQWLTASALYRVLPSHSVHDFHRARLDDYRCYLAGTPMCQSYYSAELPLAEWREATYDSSGSVKSLLAALYLDATLGADVMGQALGMFANHAPASTLLKFRLQGLAPAQSAAIDTFFDQWVFGTGNDASDKAAVQAALVDADSDDLYKFEEDKLRTNDNVDDPYLD